jgi:hypothetical protein
MSKKEDRQKRITVMDAVDYLSTLAELEIAHPQEMDQDLLPLGPAEPKWTDPEQAAQNRALIQEAFRVIYDYLHHLYEKDKSQLRDPEIQRGIQAIMVLTGEAVQKIDQYTPIFQGKLGSASELKEYQELQEFYLSKITKRFRKEIDLEESWEKEFQELAPEEIEAEKQGLKDLDTIRKDTEYELLYIAKENGQPFFNRNLTRHIRLVGEFDEALSRQGGEDDPLLKLKRLEDKQAHLSAREILHNVTPYMDEYFKEAMHHKDKEYVAAVNKAVMSLMLAANPSNLMGVAEEKSSLRYFLDFRSYLREALLSEEYQRAVASALNYDIPFIHALLNLTHSLAGWLFMRSPQPQETALFIQKLIEKGKGAAYNEEAPLWGEILENDQAIRSYLKRFPNGPLLKALDDFREEEEKWGFDPLALGNFPSQLYTFTTGELHLTVMRLPAPVHQELITKAEIVPEFRAFLRSLNTQMKGERHLLFNLQDRTSWHEQARSLALEEFQKEAEFAGSLSVVTLSKNSEFYTQTGAYQNLAQASQFIQTFQEQIASKEEGGFSFPATVGMDEINSFTKDTLQMIHQFLFAGKEQLLRKERLDFIEIFYQFFIMRIVLLLKPDSISFTCKDAIDTGEAQAAGFYAFLRMMMKQDDPWTKDEREFLLWMIYAPALLIRERAIDPARLTRIVSALTTLGSQVTKSFARPKIDKLQKAA